MNWKRVAELAIAIHDNYNKEHGCLVIPDGLPDGGKRISFNMMYFMVTDMVGYDNIPNHCGYSCCAFGYAEVLWPDKILKRNWHPEIKGVDTITEIDDFGPIQRQTIFEYNKDDPSSDSSYWESIGGEMYQKLFDDIHPNDPNQYVERTYEFMMDHNIISDKIYLSKKPTIDKLKKFVATQP